MRCGRCENIHYCSRTCQKSDWAEHKPHCGKKIKTKVVDVVPCRQHDDRSSVRSELKRLVGRGKTAAHCMICGDCQEQCPLLRTPSGVHCEDCNHIQLYAPDGFFDNPPRNKYEYLQVCKAMQKRCGGCHVCNRMVSNF